jgi:ankyrin repeat protein
MDARRKALRLISAALLAAQSLAAWDPRLIDAIKERNRDLVVSLIGAGVNVNAPEPDGATPLSWAVFLDQADVVDVLMKAGAKPDTADQYGETPLTLASSTGDFAVMEKLIAAGADAKAARWNGETALMIAARAGSVKGVKLLLEHGAKIDGAESRKGQNALMWAAAEGHYQVVDLLLASGADVKAVSKGGFTPLVFAAQRGDVHSVRSLLAAGLTPNYSLPNHIGVLHVAVSGGKPDVVQALLESNADVNTFDDEGKTPLHIAAKAGNLEIVKMLLAKGANPNLPTAAIKPPTGKAASNPFRAPAGQQTALLLAARANHEDVMRALIAAGADPKAKAQDGATLLMAAAGSGHLATVKYAYEFDPDVKAVTINKSTVMHAAVTFTLEMSTQAEVCAVIQFLASKGADVDPEDANGRTPIVIANFLPIDEAVTLMTKLIVDSGQTPKHSPKR